MNKVLFLVVVVALLGFTHAVTKEDIFRRLDAAVSQADLAMQRVRQLEQAGSPFPRFSDDNKKDAAPKTGDVVVGHDGKEILSSNGKKVRVPVMESSGAEECKKLGSCADDGSQVVHAEFTNNGASAASTATSTATVKTLPHGTQMVVGGTMSVTSKGPAAPLASVATPHTVTPTITNVQGADLRNGNLIRPVESAKPIIDPSLAPNPQQTAIGEVEQEEKDAEEDTSRARDAIDDANAKLDTTGYVGEMLAEGRNPTSHLIQRVISTVKAAEGHDVGNVSPGDTLEFDQKLVINDGASSKAAAKAVIPSLNGNEREVVAKTMQKLGTVVDEMATRVAKLEKSEADTIEKLTPAKDSKTANSEQDRLETLRKNANILQENEVASLVKNEVRILTNQIALRLRLLKENFMAEITEMFTDLRGKIGNEFVRATEEERRIVSKLNDPTESLHLKEELLVKPIREKQRISDAIAETIDRAFDKSANLADEITAQNLKAKKQYELQKKNEDEKSHEPTKHMVDSVLGQASVKAREIEKQKKLELQKLGQLEEDARQVRSVALKTAKELLGDESSELREKYSAVEKETKEEALGDEEEILAESKEGKAAIAHNKAMAEANKKKSQKMAEATVGGELSDSESEETSEELKSNAL